MHLDTYFGSQFPVLLLRRVPFLHRAFFDAGAAGLGGDLGARPVGSQFPVLLLRRVPVLHRSFFAAAAGAGGYDAKIQSNLFG